MLWTELTSASCLYDQSDQEYRAPCQGPLRVDPDPNLPEFCSFLLLAEFYLLTVLIFLFKSSEFGWGVLIKGGFLFLNPLYG